MSNTPYVIDVEEGTLYSWCTCGLSQKQPFCDGSHRGQAEQRSLKWTAPKTGKVYLCGCKATKTPPLCDGSHKEQSSSD